MACADVTELGNFDLKFHPVVVNNSESIHVAERYRSPAAAAGETLNLEKP
jgi:hypothetical protein